VYNYGVSLIAILERQEAVDFTPVDRHETVKPEFSASTQPELVKL
jgi:hypothetical protein